MLPQFEIPPAMATTGLVFSVTAGLGVPSGTLLVCFTATSPPRTSRRGRWRARRRGPSTWPGTMPNGSSSGRRNCRRRTLELNDFLYVVSHDLRAPLINLEGFSRALQGQASRRSSAARGGRRRAAAWPQLKGEIDESLDFIVRSVGKMDFLVQGLLELSRIDSRPHVAQPVDLTAQLVEMLDSLQLLHRRARHRRARRPAAVVVRRPGARQPGVRQPDRQRDQVHEAGRPGGDPRRLRAARRRRTQFFVRDTGVGIRPEDHAKIFRLFSRVGEPSVAGDGMGLTAVKKIVEKHGGRIWVESALGQGSTFWFTLSERDAAEEREDGHGARAATDQDSAG